MSESILRILQNKLLPWVERDGLEQIAIARAKLRDMKRSPRFEYSPRKLLGSRVGVRSFSFNGTTATWPQDHLLETPLPLLLFVTSGKADMPFGNYWLHAAEGQGVFALAHVPRKDGTQPYLHPDNRKEGFCSTINFAEVHGRLHIWCNKSHGETHEGSKFGEAIFSQDDRSVQLLNQLQYHFSAADVSPTNALCNHLLQSFLLTVQSDLQSGNYMKPGLMKKTLRVSLENYDPIAQAQLYIRAHLHEKLTLASVAQEVRMARTQFALRFKQEAKQTFNQFVTQNRIEQAKVLLRETEYTLTFVSVSVGYQSLTYFYQVFLKHEGITPRQYRERQLRRKKKDEKTNP